MTKSIFHSISSKLVLVLCKNRVKNYANFPYLTCLENDNKITNQTKKHIIFCASLWSNHNNECKLRPRSVQSQTVSQPNSILISLM